MKDYEISERVFYEKDWIRVGDWRKQGSAYKKKKIDIEGELAADYLKKNFKKGRILDIGCGGGRNTILFSKLGFEAVGVDFSKTAIRLARLYKKEQESNAEFMVQSVFNLRFKPSYFDAVTDFGLLHHLRKSEWRKYLQSVTRVLKKKGLFILYCFSNLSKKTGNYNPLSKRNWRVKKGHYLHYFTKKEVNELVKKEFRIIQFKTIREKGRSLVFYLVFMRKN